MNKLLINQKDKKRFADIFTFLSHNNCQCYLTPNGIDFRNHNTQGQICKDAFVEFQVNGIKKINLIQDKQILKVWIKNWNEKDKLVEIGL
jgi:hypothetical protein